jgi:hypothetical protein
MPHELASTQRDTDDAADQREGDRPHQELREDVPAARAHGHAQPDLTGPCA